MSGTPFFHARAVRDVLCTALIAGALVSCQTVTTAPADTHLTGSWSLDKSASDDPDAKVATVINTAQAKLHKRLAGYGYGPDDARDLSAEAGDTAPDAPDYSYDTPGDRFGGPGRVGPDFRGLRLRLRQALIRPTVMQLEVKGGLVSITSDQLPPRSYELGERISRFDEYGTAVITATWSHQEFDLNSRYTSHASRSETYLVDPVTGALTLTQTINDPTIGRIIVHSIYRRS
jgi:hypothetical protein